MREKQCTRCQEVLPIDSFYRSHISKVGTQIYKTKCKKCDNKDAMERYHSLPKDQRKEWYNSYNKNKEYHKNYRLTTKYGIDLSQFNEMYSQQDGKCYICQSSVPNDEIRVDHNHSTGIVRKLLCHNCNVILGHAKEDPDILLKCVEYLRDNF
jgi:hypothetical protein